MTTKGKAINQLDSHDPIQILAKPSTMPVALKVAIKVTTNVIMALKRSANTIGANFAGIIGSNPTSLS